MTAKGGEYDLTKCLIGASGVSHVTSGEYSAAYALGEDVAGAASHDSEYDLLTGYFSGYASGSLGNFSLIRATIGTSKIIQDGYQVGVPLTASVQLVFTSTLNPSTIASGIQVIQIMDHLGQSQNNLVLSTYTYDATGSTVVLSAQGAWLGNSVYEVVVNSNLQSIDGFALAEEAHVPFMTVLNPHEDNVVLHPIPTAGIPQAPSTTSNLGISLSIPTDALSDYSYVLISQDPVHSPLQADPAILQTATQKAKNTGGDYETPLALQEIAAYNEQGRPVSLSKTITYSISYTGAQGLVTGTNLPIRSTTLSLWTLDPVHELWVKMPDSRAGGTTVAGPITRFSVYALMGSSDGNASSVFAYPIPWRPHGPNAGSGPGQTGTDDSGITFSNLPSECAIKIYTISGDKVRELRHSDLSGPVAQEKWDGNTTSGGHAASGVYLWRVESATDAKNGKLMLIR